MHVCLLFHFSYRYGHDFVYHTYLYHFSRVDHRHNMSVWFLPIYNSLVGGGGAGAPPSVALGVFPAIPQFVAVLYFGVALSWDVPLAFVVQTIVFVAFNKVPLSFSCGMLSRTS